MLNGSKNIYTGFFLLLFLLVSFVISTKAVLKNQETASGSKINGSWASSYEDIFNENLSVYELSKSLWSYTNYQIYGIGKSGVLVGDGGWLFTDEEFIKHPNHNKNIQDNMDYVESVASQLSKSDVALIVAVIPAKARIYKEHLGRYVYPTYNKGIYHDFRKFLKDSDILVTDIEWIMKKKRNEYNVFLKTDTHWTPAGAKMAARGVYGVYEKNLKDTMDIEYEDIISKKSDIIDHNGDLLEFIPAGEFLNKTNLKQDRLKIYETKTQQDDNEEMSADSLFGDKEISIALVGTSYSANPLWNFDGFLKERFKSDVLNAADDGMGPFKTMEKYLLDDAFTSNRPKLVIWEIPERYLAVEYNIELPKEE